MIDININLSAKVPDREALLDEISDLTNETILKYYPLITEILNEIKSGVLKQLKEG